MRKYIEKIEILPTKVTKIFRNLANNSTTDYTNPNCYSATCGFSFFLERMLEIANGRLFKSLYCKKRDIEGIFLDSLLVKRCLNILGAKRKFFLLVLA